MVQLSPSLTQRYFQSLSNNSDLLPPTHQNSYHICSHPHKDQLPAKYNHCFIAQLLSLCCWCQRTSHKNSNYQGTQQREAQNRL